MDHKALESLGGKAMTDKLNSRNVFRYVFEFVAAGFAGWIYEVVTVWVMWHYFDNRGLLHLPIIPIYAVGAFLLLIIIRKKINPVLLFVAAFAITTVFELGASYLLEFIFHKQFWTYETWPLSILDRSSGVSSAIFGIMAVVYFYGLHPLSGKISEKLPKNFCTAFSAAAIAVIGADFVISVRQNLKG